MRATVWVVVLLVVSPFTHSQESKKKILVPGGFGTGQNFLDMDKESQRSFAIGLVDGMLLAPLFDAPDHGKTFERIQACVKDMTEVQVAAIIEKYLRDHPEDWNHQLNVESLNALIGVCPTVN